MLDQDLFLQRALLGEGLVEREQLEAAVRFAGEQGCDLADALVRTETLDGRRIALVKADVCEAPFVDLAAFEPCLANARLLPRAVAERCRAFPLFMLGDVLTVAMDDPLDLEATDRIRQIAKCEVDAVLAEREILAALVAKAYSLGSRTEEVAVIDDDRESDEPASRQPVVAAVEQILGDAVTEGASDVHINPDEHELHLRYRIDGVLRRRQGPALSMHTGLVQRLKVMASLDLTQTRRPQDGKFRFSRNGRCVDVRMSTLPTVCGENVVLRLLANAQTFSNFSELGVPPTIVSDFEETIHQPYGMILVTGPTGSGKTTTLYTALSRLNDPCRNIMTIEDPVEIRLPWVRQIQVNHEIGLTFSGALRSILRQDPDVVLVGEIRDEETATIALQAALTGHLVLSTLHTNDAVGAIARLRDYGLPSFVVNSAVLGIMAQRLVRRVCDGCRQEDNLDDVTRRRFGLAATDHGFARGGGCPRCGQTGFRGRVGIYEYLRFGPETRRLVETGASTEAIRDAAVRDGVRLMWQDGLEKARLGLTTLAEVGAATSVAEVLPASRSAA